MSPVGCCLPGCSLRSTLARHPVPGSPLSWPWARSLASALESPVVWPRPLPLLGCDPPLPPGLCRARPFSEADRFPPVPFSVGRPGHRRLRGSPKERGIGQLGAPGRVPSTCWGPRVVTWLSRAAPQGSEAPPDQWRWPDKHRFPHPPEPGSARGERPHFATINPSCCLSQSFLLSPLPSERRLSSGRGATLSSQASAHCMGH